MATTRTRRLTSDARRDKLLAFGRRYFAAHGYDELSVDDLAAKAGVSKALVYHYFGGKRGLFVATIDRVASDLELSMAPPGGLAFEQALRSSLGAFVGFIAENAAIYRVMLRGALGYDPEVQAITDRTRRAAVALVLAELRTTEPGPALSLAIAGWIGFVESASLAWLDQRARARDALDASALVEILVDALAAVLPADHVPLPALAPTTTIGAAMARKGKRA